MAAQNTDTLALYRILPENLIQRESVKLYFASALGGRVSFILETFPRIYLELKKLMWVDVLFNLSIIALATAGGGYSGGAEIGVPTLAEDSGLVRVIAHEMTHSWVLPVPLPGAGNEGWASLAAMKVARNMNYSEEANAERQYFDSVFRQADPSGTLLDISYMPPGPPENQPYMGKFMWVIESLESVYGADFMGRFMQSERTASNVCSTIDHMVFYMSLVADKDLYQWFREIGTTVGRANFELNHPADRDGVVHIVRTLSNSSITAFNFTQRQNKISFNLSGPSGTAGYCNITIPDHLLSRPYTVQVDGLPPNFTIEASNGTHNFLYFNYSHSTHSVEVVCMQTYLMTDLNKDGIVNILDISIVARAYGCKPKDPNWNEVADLNKDGVINILDISLIARDYGKTV